MDQSKGSYLNFWETSWISMRHRDTVVLSHPPAVQDEQLVRSSAGASRPDASPARGRVSAAARLGQPGAVCTDPLPLVCETSSGLRLSKALPAQLRQEHRCDKAEESTVVDVVILY